MVEGIRLVGREPAGRDVGEDGHGGPELGRRGLADALPEAVEVAPRLRPATGDQAGRHHDGVDRPGIRAADGVDDEIVLLQQPVEDAPGEGAERAAALECQREGARRAVRCRVGRCDHRIGSGVGARRQAVPGRSAGSAAPNDRLCAGTASRRLCHDSATAPRHRIPTTASSGRSEAAERSLRHRPGPRRGGGSLGAGFRGAGSHLGADDGPVHESVRHREAERKRPAAFRTGIDGHGGLVSVEETGWIPGRSLPGSGAGPGRSAAASRHPPTPSWVRRWAMQGRKSPIGVGPWRSHQRRLRIATARR